MTNWILKKVANAAKFPNCSLIPWLSLALTDIGVEMSLTNTTIDILPNDIWHEFCSWLPLEDIFTLFRCRSQNLSHRLLSVGVVTDIEVLGMNRLTESGLGHFVRSLPSVESLKMTSFAGLTLEASSYALLALFASPRLKHLRLGICVPLPQTMVCHALAQLFPGLKSLVWQTSRLAADNSAARALLSDLPEGLETLDLKLEPLNLKTWHGLPESLREFHLLSASPTDSVPPLRLEHVSVFCELVALKSPHLVKLSLDIDGTAEDENPETSLAIVLNTIPSLTSLSIKDLSAGCNASLQHQSLRELTLTTIAPFGPSFRFPPLLTSLKVIPDRYMRGDCIVSSQVMKNLPSTLTTLILAHISVETPNSLWFPFLPLGLTLLRIRSDNVDMNCLPPSLTQLDVLPSSFMGETNTRAFRRARIAAQRQLRQLMPQFHAGGPLLWPEIAFEEEEPIPEEPQFKLPATLTSLCTQLELALPSHIHLLPKGLHMLGMGLLGDWTEADVSVLFEELPLLTCLLLTSPVTLVSSPLDGLTEFNLLRHLDRCLFGAQKRSLFVLGEWALSEAFNLPDSITSVDWNPALMHSEGERQADRAYRTKSICVSPLLTRILPTLPLLTSLNIQSDPYQDHTLISATEHIALLQGLTSLRISGGIRFVEFSFSSLPRSLRTLRINPLQIMPAQGEFREIRDEEDQNATLTPNFEAPDRLPNLTDLEIVGPRVSFSPSTAMLWPTSLTRLHLSTQKVVWSESELLALHKRLPLASQRNEILLERYHITEGTLAQ